MNKILSRTKHVEIIIIAAVVAASLIIGICSFTSHNKGIGDNLLRRAEIELGRTAEIHEHHLNHTLEGQFVQLDFLADYLSSVKDFGSKETGYLVDSLFKKGSWCNAGFSDLEGNASDFSGNSLGNAREKTFFKAIVEEGRIQNVEYLPASDECTSPRFLFSVPVIKEGKVIAVLFASKEASDIEALLFPDADEDNNANIFVISDDGTILCANNAGHRLVSEDNYYSFYGRNGFTDQDLRTTVSAGGSGCFTNLHGINEVVCCTPAEINGWTIIATSDRNTLESRYSANMSVFRKQAINMIVPFGILITFIAVAGFLFFRKLSQVEREIRFEKNRNDILMNETGCELFVYDIQTKIVTTVGVLHEKYGFDFKIPLLQLIAQQRPLHPECDFERIMNAFTYATTTGKKQELVFMLSLDQKPQWIKFSLIPVSASEKEPTHVFGSFINVTAEHTEFKENAALLANMPGGFHRCYLSDPIHVEYISNGLYDLLGYTEAELEEIMVDGNYALAVYEEDRKRFDEFAYRLASAPGVEKCEYRMVRKDGSLVSVSDTMESILTSTGIMYGYSLVYDISSFTSEIETLSDELQEARVKNSLSQMQPHFLYNALASIREIILDNPEYASELVVDFTTHLRACIKAMSTNDLIPFSREIENIKAYVNIEKMRFGEKLNIKYDIACDDFSIVPLSIQPLVENSIRHGIYERGAAGGTVLISAYKSDKGYTVCVKDDGVGFDYHKKMKEMKENQSDSVGLSSLIFRLEKQLGANVEIESSIGVGTEVTVNIPI